MGSMQSSRCAQEYMENGALSTVIKPNKFGPFMEPLVSAITAQVLRGLAYLHEQGVVHRDIKGANILTTKEVRSLAGTFSPRKTVASMVARLMCAELPSCTGATLASALVLSAGRI